MLFAFCKIGRVRMKFDIQFGPAESAVQLAFCEYVQVHVHVITLYDPTYFDSFPKATSPISLHPLWPSVVQQMIELIAPRQVIHLCGSRDSYQALQSRNEFQIGQDKRENTRPWRFRSWKVQSDPSDMPFHNSELCSMDHWVCNRRQTIRQ